MERMTFSPSFKRISKAVCAGAMVIVATTVWWNHFSPEGKRRARVEAARLHAKNVVMPLLAKEHRFEEVHATEWWKDDGYLFVNGGVETEADLQDLKQLVISTHPPASIAWDVEVFGKDSAITNRP
jgi:hypothetical protein